MATVTSPARTAPAVAPAGISRARAVIVAALLTLGAVAVAAMVLWQPWGERNQLGYGDIAPHRDAAWLGLLIDGIGVATLGIALGIATCMLVTARGSAWANTGAVLAGFGGVVSCAGSVAFGAFAWYATATAAIPTGSGTDLMAYVDDNRGHLLALEMVGFLMTTLGSLVLMVALWRGRAVPRWLPIGYLVLTAGLFTLSGVVLDAVQAIQTLSLLVVAFQVLRLRGRSAVRAG